MSDDIKQERMREVSEAIDQENDNEGWSPDDPEVYNEDGSPKPPEAVFRSKFRATKPVMEIMNAHAIGADAEEVCFSTGFSNLDELLDGGLYCGELYIMGAVSSLGKTSIMLQMADQIAAQGTDVIYVSLEMSATELVSKSLSRLTYQLCEGKPYEAKTARGITSAKRFAKYTERERMLIGKACSEYTRTMAPNIYFLEGVGDVGVGKIAEFVKDHKKLIRKKAVVMIDYLQVLAPHDPRYSDKMNVDKNVLELRRLSRDEDIPVVAISSFNRDSYTNEVTMAAFKESGAIEYGSDVLIAFQPQGMLRGYRKDIIAKNTETMISCKREKNLRKVEAVILKNRYGATETRTGFEYRPRFNLFEVDRKYKDRQDEAFESGQDQDDEWTTIASTGDADIPELPNNWTD